MKRRDPQKFDQQLGKFLTDHSGRQVRRKEGEIRRFTYDRPSPVFLRKLREWIPFSAFEMMGPWLFLGGSIFGLLILGLWLFPRYLSSETVNEIRFHQNYYSRDITDMAIHDRYVFLATEGNGLQRYDKRSYLWRTFNKESTLGLIDDTLRQIVYDSVPDHVWLLNDARDIIAAPVGKGKGGKVLKTGSSWANLDTDDITTATLLGDQLYFGSDGYEAATYNIPEHSWTRFERTSPIVRQLEIRDSQVWIAGNKGIQVFNRFTGTPVDSVGILKGASVEKFKTGEHFDLAVTRDSSLYFYQNKEWGKTFGGGTGLIGLKPTEINQAYLDDQHLILGSNNKGIALYDREEHTWSSIAKSYRFKDITKTDDYVFAALSRGLKVFNTRRGLAEKSGKPLHPTLGVTFLRNSGQEIIYSTSNNGIWRSRGESTQPLIPPAGNFGHPGEVLQAVPSGDSVIWLATSKAGILRYDLRRHLLEQGSYSKINGRAVQADQLLLLPEGLCALVNNRVFTTQYGSWQREGNLNRIKEIFQSGEQLLYLNQSNVLRTNNLNYFEGRMKGTAQQQYFGEIIPEKNFACLALPEGRVVRYNTKTRRWSELTSQAPPDSLLSSFHSNGHLLAMVTQDGALYGKNELIFQSDPLPAPLEEAIDMVSIDSLQPKALVLWDSILAAYDPAKGLWEKCELDLSAGDYFKAIRYINGRLFVFSTSNQYWIHSDPVGRWKNNWQKEGGPSNQVDYVHSNNNGIWFRKTDCNIEHYYAHENFPDHFNYFTDQFPSLDKASFFVKGNIDITWVVSEQHVGSYDHRKHNWIYTPIDTLLPLGDKLKQALYYNDQLFVVTTSKLLSFWSYDGKIKSSEYLPPIAPLALTKAKSELFLWLKEGKQLALVPVNYDQDSIREVRQVMEETVFNGNLNRVTSAIEVQQKLWVADDAGNIALYDPDKVHWDNYPRKQGERVVRFIGLRKSLLLQTEKDQKQLFYAFNPFTQQFDSLQISLNDPSFYYYPKAGKLYIGQKGSVFHLLRERGGYIDFDPLDNTTDYRTIDLNTDLAGTASFLLQHNISGRQAILHDSNRILLPRGLRLSGLKKVQADQNGRLWILGNNRQLYVARIRPRTETFTPSDQLESQLDSLNRAISVTRMVMGNLSEPVEAFEIKPSSGVIEIWIGTNEKLTHFVKMNAISGFKADQEQVLPLVDKLPEDLYWSPNKQALIIRQDSQYFQMRENSNLLHQLGNNFSKYNYEHWQKRSFSWMELGENHISDPQKMGDPIQASRWNWTNNDKDYLDFSYRPELSSSRFKSLKSTPHSFLKDQPLAVGPYQDNLFLIATADGLFQYDLNGLQKWSEILDKKGNPIIEASQLYSNDSKNWIELKDKWYEIRVRGKTCQLKESFPRFEIHSSPDKEITWWQESPNQISIRMGGQPLDISQGLAFDQVSDLGTAQGHVFFSTKAGVWWRAEKQYREAFQLDTILKEVSFLNYHNDRVIALKEEQYYEFVDNKWKRLKTLPDRKVIQTTYSLNNTSWVKQSGQPGVKVSNQYGLRSLKDRHFEDDIINDAIPFFGTMWVASNQGIWALRARKGGIRRLYHQLANTKFLRFYRDNNKLFAVDEDEQVYMLEDKKWMVQTNLRPNFLIKETSNQMVCFQQLGEKVRLERTDGRSESVWMGNSLIGDTITTLKVIDEKMLAFAPGLGVVRYHLPDMVLDTIFNEAFGDTIPEKVDFYSSYRTGILHLRNHERYWQISQDKLSDATGIVWQQPETLADMDRFQWYRPKPNAAEVLLEINGQQVSEMFSGSRLLFDDFDVVYVDGVNYLWLGNERGLFQFRLRATPRLIDYVPFDGGIKAITEYRENMFIQSNDNSIWKLENGAFERSEETAFQKVRPSLLYADNRFRLENISFPISEYKPGLRIRVPEGMPVFNPNGTFLFDNFLSAIPLAEDQWLGATPIGMGQYSIDTTGRSSLLQFFPYEKDYFPDPLKEIIDIRKKDNEVYLWGSGKEDHFYHWTSDQANPYSEKELEVFNQDQVVFSPEKALWQPRSASYNSNKVLEIVDAPKYPLFVSDLDQPAKGRFAFDDVRSFWVKDNVLWVASRGGLLRYRYQPGPKEELGKLVFENIYTTGSNLKSYDILMVQPGQQANSLDLLEAKGGDQFRQSLLLGNWQEKSATMDLTIKSIDHHNLQALINPRSGKQSLRLNQEVIWTGLPVASSTDQILHQGDSTYFVVRDSIVILYHAGKNQATPIQQFYPLEGDSIYASLNGPLMLGVHEQQLMIKDGSGDFFFTSDAPAFFDQESFTASASTSLSVGNLRLNITSGALSLSSPEIGSILSKGKDLPFAIIQQEEQLFIFKDADHFSSLIFDAFEEKYNYYDQSELPSTVYRVKSGEQLPELIRTQELGTGEVTDPATKWAMEYIITQNEVIKKDAKGRELKIPWLYADRDIKIPHPDYRPAFWPDKEYMLYGKNIARSFKDPSTHDVLDQTYVVDSTYATFWVRDHFVKVDHNRGTALQLFPPVGTEEWHVLQNKEDLLLFAFDKKKSEEKIYSRVTNQLVDREEDFWQWDPYREKRIEVPTEQESVVYFIHQDRTLSRDQQLLNYTKDLIWPSRFSDIIDMEKDAKKLWVATRKRLIQIHLD